MADISSFITPNNTEYNFKDAAAREAIAAINGREWYVVTNAADTPIGVKWTRDGVEIVGTLVASADTKAKIYFVPDVNATGKNVYNEYITVSPTSGTYIWEMFGTTDINVSSLGDLAYKSSASGEYTPHGSVSVSTNTTTNQTATVSPAQSGDATYTPGGTVSAPTISLKTAGATDTIKNPTAKTMVKNVVAVAPGEQAPSNVMTYYAVEGEKLKLYQIGYGTEASITTENKTVKTGDAEYESSTPSFSGTGVRLETGAIPVPATYSATFTGNEETITVS